jgi:hypothetical protein
VIEGVTVFVGVGVGVLKDTLVLVTVGVGLFVGVIEGVTVFVGVKVKVAVGVFVGVDVLAGVFVGVFDGVTVGVTATAVVVNTFEGDAVPPPVQVINVYKYNGPVKYPDAAIVTDGPHPKVLGEYVISSKE